MPGFKPRTLFSGGVIGQAGRWKKAQRSDTPVEVVTLEEAKARELKPEQERYVTWKFQAENVRDFAWGSSRKFIWDAMSQPVEGKDVMCMSFYPKEAYALYSRYSTKVVAHTLRVYSKHTIAYPNHDQTFFRPVNRKQPQAVQQ